MTAAAIRLSKQLQKIAADLQGAINDAAGEPVAFTLFVFTGGRASYISTTTRDVSVREVTKVFEMWEQGMPDIPAHKVDDL